MEGMFDGVFWLASWGLLIAFALGFGAGLGVGWWLL